MASKLSIARSAFERANRETAARAHQAGSGNGRMNHHEVYKLDCCYCSHTIELPAGSVERGLVACPRCGGMLEIRWRWQRPQS